LTDKADCPLQTATKLIQHFRSQNLVSLGMRIDFIKSEENVSRVMADYFEPSFKIAHHVSLQHEASIMACTNFTAYSSNFLHRRWAVSSQR
jgi:hypothetical protein